MREQDKDKIKKALPEIVDGLQRIIEIPVEISRQLATVNHAFSQISQQITKIHWLAFENLANQYRLLEKDYEKWKEGGTDIFFKAEYPQPDKFIFGLDYCLRSIEIDFTVNNLPGVGRYVYILEDDSDKLLYIYLTERGKVRIFIKPCDTQFDNYLMFNYLTNSILEDVVNGGIFDQFEFDDLDTVTEHDKDNHKPELEIKVFTPEQNKQILEACKGWAGLGYKEKDQTISDYLQEFSETTGIHVSKKQFETALRRAGERGIIIKKKGRWKLP